jgi:hypothetical protein
MPVTANGCRRIIAGRFNSQNGNGQMNEFELAQRYLRKCKGG